MLKERVYNSIQGRFFCPNCHREITNNFVGLNHVNFKGVIKFGCGYCKKGNVIIRPVKTNTLEIFTGEQIPVGDKFGHENQNT